jgi:hypothetical protein
MLDDSTNDPIIVHAQVALPHTANLSLTVHTLRGIQPRCDLLWSKQALVVIPPCHPEDSLRRRPDILVSEPRAPDDCIYVESAAITEAESGGGVCHRLDETAHGYLAFCDELGAADIDVVATSTLD